MLPRSRTARSADWRWRASFIRSEPEIRVVVLLDSPQRDLVVEAFRSGAKGVFCRSDFEIKALWKCVASVNSGQISGQQPAIAVRDGDILRKPRLCTWSTPRASAC